MERETPAGRKVIGIVGGVGPFAGLDLNRKIFEETVAPLDQDHLTVILLSAPCRIPDRTAYLAGREPVNPSRGHCLAIDELVSIGANVIGIPCNTSHAPRIFGEIRDHVLGAYGERVTLAHLIEEVGRHLRQTLPHAKSVGVLATTGTVLADSYGHTLASFGLETVHPLPADQEELVHAAIYDPEFGIKAHSSPILPEVRRRLNLAARKLIGEGVDAVVLGCTELSLVFDETHTLGVPVVDSNRVLARALVRLADPAKLRPLAD